MVAPGTFDFLRAMMELIRVVPDTTIYTYL
jgi:hypothetical protein